MKNAVVAILLVVLVAVSAGAGYFAGVVNQRATTVTTTATSFVTASGSTLPAECPSGGSFNTGFGGVAAMTNSPSVVCLLLYYYNSASTLTLNLTSALSIQALQYIHSGNTGTPRSFSGAANFTVTTSQEELVIGGPANEDEGTLVAYAITAKAGASGTYQLGFVPTGGLSNWLLNPQEPEQCPYYGQLMAGNGQPNYVQPTGCISYIITTNASSPGSATGPTDYNLPGISYSLIIGDVYFEMVGVVNSTG